MSITILGAIVIATAIYQFLVIVYLILLTLGDIVNWFRTRFSLLARNRNKLAFTLQDLLSNGKYTTVQGVFNTQTNQVEAARKIISNHVDNQVSRIHRNERLAIYS